MQIGIITLQESNNYGAVWQAYALQIALQKLGHAPLFPAIIPYAIYRRGIKKYIGRSVADSVNKWYELAKMPVFEKFRNTHLNRVNPCRKALAQDFLNAPFEAPVYITGSDQVWNPHFAPSGTPDRAVFWLNFLGKSLRRISYAASFGTSFLSEAEKAELSPLIGAFDAVSVREEDALALLQELGAHGKWVCDPTLLLDRTDYERLIRSEGLPPRARAYLYEYELHWPTETKISQVREMLLKRHPWQVYAPFPSEVYKKMRFATWDSPVEWVNKIAHAEMILTNSFHGTIFSILFKRPFITFPLAGQAGRSNGRIYSLLQRLGLENRIMRSASEAEVEEIAARDVDWDVAHEKLDVWRRESLVFLIDALALCK